MERSTINNIIGFTLIFILLFVWMRINAPKNKPKTVETAKIEEKATAKQEPQVAAPIINKGDSLTADQKSVLNSKFGDFSESAIGESKEVVLENDVMKVAFSSKGGRISKVTLKKFDEIKDDAKGNEVKSVLEMNSDNRDKWEYLLPVGSGNISTQDLIFQPSVKDKAVTFTALGANGKSIEQTYILRDGQYDMDYSVKFNNLGTTAKTVDLNWVSHLDRIEKNTKYEMTMSTVYYKPAEGAYDYCNCTKEDSKDIAAKPLKWVSHANQFFNTALIANSTFQGGLMSTVMTDPKDEALKVTSSKLKIPVSGGSSDVFSMKIYTGPNEFNRLRSYGVELEDVIPYGSSILGSINRWIIRPLFEFLNGFIGSKGIVILLLTLIVKLIMFPLSYKMIYSQSKMAALKPQIDKLKDKHGDDQQTIQMETMKMYREFGVNPLGGCLPMLLQMPIWFALYRFFPAAIDFRQASFLWATDLSSFDVFSKLPFEIPFFGSHLSMFALLWSITTLIFTYYSTKDMDMSANPAMKYMQYAMPIIFLGFFNNFASGLSAYLCFSNILNIGQTLGTKQFLINHEKIKKQMDEYKSKPKKKSGFAARLEQAMEMQKKAQEQNKKK
jgi:YidC/Oxa1 family membrane protein insertase